MKFNSFMNEAILQARKAYDCGEVPVGAVIVDGKTNEIIARSHNQNIGKKDATAHAEMLAIQGACSYKNSHRLDGCDLYVTLEPCAMCATAISYAKIRRLYYGASDIKFGAVENGARILSSSNCLHKPEIYSGIEANKSAILMKEFFSELRKEK